MLKLINIIMKLLLAGLVVHAMLFNELTQYRAKAFGIRMALYPLVACATYVFYVTRLKKRKPSYPIIADLCLTTVVFADFAGNTLNLYDSIAWWDDAMHFLISIPWVIAGGLLLQRYSKGKLTTFMLVAGYGAITHIIWEIFEYFSFVRSNSSEFATAYEDTIYDLILSLSGAIVGALICVYMLKPAKKK